MYLKIDLVYIKIIIIKIYIRFVIKAIAIEKIIYM